MTVGEEKGFEVEKNVDYGYGAIDLVWYINHHPLLQSVRCGFIALGSEKKSTISMMAVVKTQRITSILLEEAAMRGIRSGMDKVFLVVQNKEMAKSVSGKIEWLASF
jgi:hypothetical protein